MASDETLVYKARFDASGIEQGNAAAAKSFEQLDKTAATTFASIEKASQKASKPPVSQEAAWGGALAKYEESKRKTVEIDEDVYEQQARLQARRESEYETALHQANLAEASLITNGWERKLALQRIMMEKELSEYAGNLEAQEQITRKHMAIMQAIQVQQGQSTDRPERVILQRLGTVTSAANRAQGVLFGVSPLLGNLGGGLAQTAAGLMGVSTSLDAVAASGTAALLPLGAMVGALTAVGIAVALFTKHKKEMEDLRNNPDWLGDPGKVDQITKAMKDYAQAQATVNAEKEKSLKATGGVTMNDQWLLAAAHMQTAEAEIRKLTGYKGSDFQGFIDGFGGMQKAVEGFSLVTQARLMDARNELARSQIDGMKDGLDKSLALEDQRYKESIDNEHKYLAQVLLDTKKTEKEKQEAAKQSADTIDVLTKTHEQNRSNIRKEFLDKASKEEQERAKRDYAALRDREQKQIQESQRAMDDQAKWLTDAQNRQLEEKNRLVFAQAHTQTETLLAQQKIEEDSLNTRIASYQYLEDEVIKAASIEIAKQEQVAQSARHLAERQKAIGDLNKQLAASYISLGSQIADTFDIGPAKEFFQWLERIRTLVETIKTIQSATKALGLLGGGGAGVSLMGLLGFANGGRPPVGTPYIVGEKGPEIRVDDAPGRIYSNSDSKAMMGGASYNFGSINVNVGAGANPGTVGRAVKSAVLEAAQQIESLRNQRHYNDGTLASQ